MEDERPQFPSGLNQFVDADLGTVVFGTDVLATLVQELEATAAVRRTEREWGPGVLGCAMWMDDPALVSVLKRMANVCIVVTKQSKKRFEQADTDAIQELAQSNGLAQAAYDELSELAPLQDGHPVVVGPGSGRWDENDIGAVREVGFRRVGNRLVPIVHAKILLLGDMYWTDEHPAGAVVDIIGFRPRRLWIGSANFTKSSRSSLEMGLWTSDPKVLAAARQWLLALVAISEPLGTGSDDLAPEFASVEYDDVAFFEYLREAGGWSSADHD